MTDDEILYNPIVNSANDGFLAAGRDMAGSSPKGVVYKLEEHGGLCPDCPNWKDYCVTVYNVTEDITSTVTDDISKDISESIISDISITKNNWWNLYNGQVCPQ